MVWWWGGGGVDREVGGLVGGSNSYFVLRSQPAGSIPLVEHRRPEDIL